jgi:hypothetical protein
MANKRQPNPPAPEREDRIAAALRENLRKRKTQAQLREKAAQGEDKRI